MSSFGAKRKGRIIQTLDDEDADLGPSLIGGHQPKKSSPSQPQGPIKFSKPSKSSALRRSINVYDEDLPENGGAVTTASGTNDEEDEDGPVVIRPAVSRSGSVKSKKRASSSRLSFGPGEGEAKEAEPFTPKKSLGQRELENNALKMTNLLQNLPTRFGGDDEGPRYSKAYLEELQSSTPNTPQNISSLKIADDEDEAMSLDPSELEGALVVQSQDIVPAQPQAAAKILSAAEIREKKDRRARLAQESGYIALDGSDEEEGDDSGRVTVQFKKKKPESRLIAEDEDLGEGYDEFVSDGGLALGKKAERDAARRHRQEMVDLIQAAEEGSDAESDDSETERRAAYEAAQRRAGMDGLHRHEDDMDIDMSGGVNVIPRMKPLPDLDEVLQRMRDLVQGMEDEVTRRRARISQLEKEKGEIVDREKEVQTILDAAGAKYQAAMGRSPQRGASGFGPSGLDNVPMERGLESFGNTPTTRPDIEDAM